MKNRKRRLESMVKALEKYVHGHEYLKNTSLAHDAVSIRSRFDDLPTRPSTGDYNEIEYSFKCIEGILGDRGLIDVEPMKLYIEYRNELIDEEHRRYIGSEAKRLGIGRQR